MANGGAPHDPPDAAQTLEARDSVSLGFPRRDRSQSDRTGCAGGIPFRRAELKRFALRISCIGLSFRTMPAGPPALVMAATPVHRESRITSDGTVFIQVDLPPEF
jgi:hypothetical protein